MTVGQRVLDLLAKQGKLQRDLADFLGTGASTVSQWKLPNRNPTVESIIPICEFLGVSPYFLLTGEESSSVDLSDFDLELLQWVHKLKPETQRDFLGEIRLYAKKHPADLEDQDPEEMLQAK